jgi:DNA-3-methyladenine glycosylase
VRKILKKDFFDRPTLEVARDLLGKYLVREADGEKLEGMIVETEAYDGPEDLACQARSGITKRNFVMFGPAGMFYVYFTYGMHWMLNVVVGKKGYGAAVLIRGLDTVSGPARLTKAFKIDKSLNSLQAKKSSGLWFEDRGTGAFKIKTTPRIGVDYAGIWAKKPYRYLLASD